MSSSRIPVYVPQPLPSVFVEETPMSKRLDDRYDSTIIIYHDVSSLESKSFATLSEEQSLANLIATASSSDAAFDKNVNVFHKERMIMCGTGKLNRSYDDVRRFTDAVSKAVKRAKAAKWVKPLLIIQEPPFAGSYAHYLEVSLLAALTESYDLLQARETLREPLLALQSIGLQASRSMSGEALQLMQYIEEGRRLARDIGGADPERMTALRVAETIKKYFEGLDGVIVNVTSDREQLMTKYPLLMAVARGSEPVPRHAPCVISLAYKSPDQSAVEEELFFVGKGVTYDTGGMDVKTGGIMREMSKDKCGAASVAGFMAVVAKMRPRHLNVTCRLAMVRNSVGSNGYVADEILVGRSNVRVRVGNTDAEGRMAMADVLCEAKEEALRLPDPGKARLFTCATLTGHAGMAVGSYPIAMDNGLARKLGIAESLQTIGNLIGEPFEVSMVRRDDYKAIEAKNNSYDVEQIVPTSLKGIRGHQYPAAFLSIVSGLQELEDRQDAVQLAYTHLDIAGVMDDKESGKPLAIPVAALSARYLYSAMRRLLK